MKPSRSGSHRRIIKELISRALPIKVKGNSMHPWLHAGSTVTVVRKATTQIKVGDIVLYEDGREYILHRLIYKASGRLVTKGDANGAVDPPVGVTRVVGIVETARSATGRTFRPIKKIEQDVYRRYWTILAGLLAEFDKQGIEYAITGGHPLAQFYRALPKMGCIDCEILVTGGFGPATRIVGQSGFVPMKPYPHEPFFSFLGKSKQRWIKMLGSVPICIGLDSRLSFISKYRLFQDFFCPSELTDKLSAGIVHSARRRTVYKTGIRLPDNAHALLCTILDLFHHDMYGAHRYQLIGNISRLAGVESLHELLLQYRLPRTMFDIGKLTRSIIAHEALGEGNWWSSIPSRLRRYFNLKAGIKPQP